MNWGGFVFVFVVVCVVIGCSWFCFFDYIVFVWCLYLSVGKECWVFEIEWLFVVDYGKVCYVEEYVVGFFDIVIGVVFFWFWYL